VYQPDAKSIQSQRNLVSKLTQKEFIVCGRSLVGPRHPPHSS
jgi:hypothetical protein